MIAEWTRDLDEAGVVRLADLLALKIRKGDVVALRGEVGAGKTTLARALIVALLHDRAAEVPSPTFSLSQVYETPRLTVCGLGHAAGNIRRIDELMAFLDGQPRWRGTRIAYLQGDASTRSYARLF